MDVTDAIRIARLSDIGLLRDHNEDAVASDLSIGLVILADGMGGYKAGEIASEIAVLIITANVAEAMQAPDSKGAHLPESEILTDAVEKANAAIYQISQEYSECEGMGTTLVAGIFADNKLVVGHIGDSRMYRLRDLKLAQLTEDHSLLQEQLNIGLITEAQAKESNNKNLVTRALGIDPEVELELHEHDVEVDDIYLLCSDGLTDLVSDEEIRVMLVESASDIEHAAINLIRFANVQGGRDNISVVIARVKKEFSAKHRWIKVFLGKTNK